MNENNLKWLCSPSEDEEVWQSSEYFDTKEEAINAGKKALREFIENPENEYDQSDVLGHVYEEYEGVHTVFAVGQAFSPHLCIDAGDVIENLQEQAGDCCGEVAENYLDDVTKGELEDLEEALNDALQKWLTEYNHQPTFHYINNVEKIELEDTDAE
ncbi:hypothetical protein C8U37_107133 [Trichococcus patagoniensis]|uniref:Uncharacterized protein n=1 Tax=Trichococcus patagoniensis TaxID=382641 RepID=A0A2T5ILR1_9LACT|nr:hypothetical protein [Trichococcus patagoniensis]PTQ84765.1 hypothetical protein C8U37_107133 [Trichococcus patagoniensis]